MTRRYIFLLLGFALSAAGIARLVEGRFPWSPAGTPRDGVKRPAGSSQLLGDAQENARRPRLRAGARQ